MKSDYISSPPVFKIALKISALAVALIFVTYGLIWLLLNAFNLLVEVSSANFFR